MKNAWLASWLTPSVGWRYEPAILTAPTTVSTGALTRAYRAESPLKYSELKRVLRTDLIS